MDQKAYASHLAARLAGQEVATLAAPGASVEVDWKQSTIKGCSVMTCGQAKGWGFSIDQTSLKQMLDLCAAASPGVKVRFKHPADLSADTLGTDVGYLTNCRIDGAQLRGDVVLGSWSSALPGLGDVRTYLMKKCADDPSGIGLSAVIAYTTEPQMDAQGNLMANLARIHQLQSVDFVANPAANPNGLLSADAAPSPAAHTQIPTPTPVQEHNMPDQTPNVTNTPAAPAASTPAPAAAALATPAAELDIVALEEKRVASLKSLAKAVGVPDDVAALSIAEDDDLKSARVRFLAYLKEHRKPITGVNHVEVGPDKKIASLRAALPDAMCIKGGVSVKDAHELAPKYASMSVVDMYRHYLVALGASADEVSFISKTQMVDLMGTRNAMSRFGLAALAQGTSSFSSVVLDAFNKSARIEYQLMPKTWPVWARKTTAPDFKNINRVQISDVASLVSRAQGGEIKYFNVKDSKETYALVEYVNGIRITRQAMINDDLGLFMRMTRAQVGAAAQLEEDVVYAVLTGGLTTTMADTGAIFNATATTTAGGHANLDSATAKVGAPSVTTLGYGRLAMRKQTGPNGQYLNIIPKFLIVPAALESVAWQYTSPNFTPTASTAINPFAAGGATPLTVVVQPRLDAEATYGGYAWFLAADNSQIDTVEIAFLEGEPEPVLKQEADFDTDDMKFAVRHSCAAKAIDFRGLYRNNGTT